MPALVNVNEYDEPDFFSVPESKRALPSDPLSIAVAVWPGHAIESPGVSQLGIGSVELSS